MTGAQVPPSFVNKPPRGWLHSDHLFAKDGINYAVRYVGHLNVLTSMKILDFDTRSAIAKESISRVCEESQSLSEHQIEDRRRRVDRRISSILGDRVVVSRSGANVQLTITSLCLRLSDLDNGSVLLQHEMPMISFASGGDSDSLDYIAYVAKDSSGGRACYVLECEGGLAQDVITTIGQAFELRFKEFLKKTPGSRPPPLPALRHAPLPDEVEYYNDLPGKTPPSSNLIDFNTEIPYAPEYTNGEIQDQRTGRHRDPFDMSPFALNPPGGGIPSPVTPTPITSSGMRAQLGKEEWFHGPISRYKNSLGKRNGFMVLSPGRMLNVY
ncbi:SHC-transforming protein 1 isoform X2 [Eurytemora carolleeae]|uniref:SHC-transforming protein 1 isoform X2 n=1 Tax=Eurytemora carolleeae TaxID=1294199 RepID=UPI000C75B5F3|nr:SHC-transforming protein 1 isoform X2 [Eurytemora carolleeae]|eukprot:XP_023329219.1 SHC-transforming protein 1-like isoform X2 [Eurytemora affinis]